MRRFCLAICVAAALAAPADADELRIVSWDLANLAQGPGIDLRGYTRSQEDYDQLQSGLARCRISLVSLEAVTLPA